MLRAHVQSECRNLRCATDLSGKASGGCWIKSRPAAAEGVLRAAGEDEPTVSLAGASADIHLNWTNRLAFADGEEFSWRKVLSCLRA